MTGRLVDSIRCGDRVTILSPHGQKLRGRAVMPAKGGIGWVLNLGGRHGTPGIATDENTISVKKRKEAAMTKEGRIARELLEIAATFWREDGRPLAGKEMRFVQDCAKLMNLPFSYVAARPAYSEILIKEMEKGKNPEEAILEFKRHRAGSSKTAVTSYVLTRNAKTSQAEFKSGEKVLLKEYKQMEGRSIWLVKLESEDGRRLGLPIVTAYKYLRGFPRPPSVSMMERWSDDGVAKAVDGSRVEPDGVSTNGAPSWLLVMNVI